MLPLELIDFHYYDINSVSFTLLNATLKKEQYKYTDIYIRISTVFSRIFKNINFINKYWKIIIGRIDKVLYKKKWDKYKIIPMGEYCLPRVITTINKLKPSKINGEKTLPFDIAFFKDIERNIYLIKTGFKDVFDEVTYNEEYNYWVNKNYFIEFNHEEKFSLDELKLLYKKRIENLYEYINDKTKHIYFLIATFKPINVNKLEELLSYMKEQRGDNEFDIIIINQAKEEIYINNKQIHIINMGKDTFFSEHNKDGNWASQLKSLKSVKARAFYKSLTEQLREIIN